MTPEPTTTPLPVHQLLADLAQVGINLSAIPDGSLRVRAKAGVMTPEWQEAIRSRKPEILAFLHDPLPRFLTLPEKEAAEHAWHDIRRTHRKELKEAGWSMEEVFGGVVTGDLFSPATAVSVDHLPGILAILMAGGKVEVIHPDKILLRDSLGARLTWWRDGYFTIQTATGGPTHAQQ